ncbi:MAG: M23 family metallopeptidase [Candidatus Obscuribacterales bacterium]|nr:M23 family metallopeptidase [Candidatus Obscuribacterales bacterium]
MQNLKDGIHYAFKRVFGSLSALIVVSAAIFLFFASMVFVYGSGVLENAVKAQSKTEPAGLAPQVVPGVCALVDRAGQAVKPMDCLKVGADLYFLDANCLWASRGGVNALEKGGPLICQKTSPPGDKLQGVPIQEFLAFVYFPAHESIAVLDKSGSLFEFLKDKNSWRLLMANVRTLGSPDPHYVSFAANADHLCLLDPERNQIWRFPSPRAKQKYFSDVLPWRIKRGDPNVADAIGIVIDGPAYVLRHGGGITRYSTDSHGGNGNPQPIGWKPLAGMRPTRLQSASEMLYVVERENNRVIALAKKNGQAKAFLFPQDSDLRGLLADEHGFWIVDGNRFVRRELNKADNLKEACQPRRSDPRLEGIAMPVKGGHLPRHTGVFPGARRLYRHGVHQGLDFFHDAGTTVSMNTPAVAAAPGKVIRADINYRDMSGAEYAKVMADCARSQFCTEANEDLFRGCQVWLDHGHGLITKYAHLNKARNDLKPGMKVARGETVGYIGVSGTGENHVSSFKHPHLHFEIWLDDHYLGYGLTLPETIGVYEEIFDRAPGRSMRQN